MSSFLSDAMGWTRTHLKLVQFKLSLRNTCCAMDYRGFITLLSWAAANCCSNLLSIDKIEVITGREAGNSILHLWSIFACVTSSKKLNTVSVGTYCGPHKTWQCGSYLHYPVSSFRPLQSEHNPFSPCKVGGTRLRSRGTSTKVQ